MGCVRGVHNSSHAQAKTNYVCTSFNNNFNTSPPPNGIHKILHSIEPIERSSIAQMDGGNYA
jgi:hypothetical protein